MWRSFWLTHIRIGFCIFMAETVVVIGYLALTPDGPHRSILWAVAVSWLLLASVGMSLAPTVASKPWCGTYSVTWTALSAFGVAIVAVLDGGMNSPILILLFLPLIYGTLMFTPRAAGICGVAAVASLALVALIDRDVASSPAGPFFSLRHSPVPPCSQSLPQSIGLISNNTRRSFRQRWQTWRPLTN